MKRTHMPKSHQLMHDIASGTGNTNLTEVFARLSGHRHSSTLEAQNQRDVILHGVYGFCNYSQPQSIKRDRETESKDDRAVLRTPPRNETIREYREKQYIGLTVNKSEGDRK